MNNFRKVKSLLPREHFQSSNLRTVFPRDPKDVVSEASLKVVNETVERVRVLRLINAERWVLARRSASSKIPEDREYEEESSRDVTQEGSQDHA